MSAKLADIKLAISNWDTSNATYIQSIQDKMVTPKNNYIKDINAYNTDVNNTLQTTMNELTLCSRNPKGKVPIARGRQSSDVRYTDAYAEAVWYDSGDGGYTNVMYYRWMNTGHDAVYVYMFADDYVKLYVNDHTFRGSTVTNHTYSSPGAYTPHKIDTRMGLKKFGCNTFKFKIYDDRKSEHFTAAVYSKIHDYSKNGSMKKYALFATGPSWNEGWFFISSMKRREGTSYTLPASQEHVDTRATSTPDKTILNSIIESTKKMPSLTASNYVVDNNDIITKKEYSMSKQQSVMSILNNVDSGNNSNVYKKEYDELFSKYKNELDSHKDEISKLNSDNKESLDKSNHYIRNLEIRNKCKPPTGSDNPSKHGKQITNRIYNDVGAEGIWDNVYGSDVANVLYYNWLNPGLDKVYVYMYCDDYVKLYVNGFNWIASSTYEGDAPSKANEVVPRSDGKGFLKNGCNVFKFLVRERDGDQHLTVAVYAQPHDSKKSAQENEKNLLFASGPKWNQDWYVFEEMRTTGEKNNELRLSDGKARQPSWLQDWIGGLNATSFIYKPVTKENCLESAKEVYGDKVTAKRGKLIAGNWGHLPQGCSVQSGGDWAAHWNNTDGNNSGRYTKVVVPLSILNNVDSGNNSNDYKTQYDELYSQYNNKLDSHTVEISQLKSDQNELDSQYNNKLDSHKDEISKLKSDHKKSIYKLIPATRENCLDIAKAEYGDKVTAKRGTLIAGNWPHLPQGCSVQSGGDWAAHWNDKDGYNNGTYTKVGDIGTTITKANCLDRAKAEFGSKVTAKRGHLSTGNWWWVPQGCSVASNNDWAAHWNYQDGTNNGEYLNVGDTGPMITKTNCLDRAIEQYGSNVTAKRKYLTVGSWSSLSQGCTAADNGVHWNTYDGRLNNAYKKVNGASRHDKIKAKAAAAKAAADKVAAAKAAAAAADKAAKEAKAALGRGIGGYAGPVKK